MGWSSTSLRPGGPKGPLADPLSGKRGQRAPNGTRGTIRRLTPSGVLGGTAQIKGEAEAKAARGTVGKQMTQLSHRPPEGEPRGGGMAPAPHAWGGVKIIWRENQRRKRVSPECRILSVIILTHPIFDPPVHFLARGVMSHRRSVSCRFISGPCQHHRSSPPSPPPPPGAGRLPPYLLFVCWLDLVTLMQHTDSNALFFRGNAWSFLRGAMSTVVRTPRPTSRPPPLNISPAVIYPLGILAYVNHRKS